MLFDMMPCSEEDTEFIEEQAARVFDAIAPPEEAIEEEEFVYKVTDEKGSLLGGCILAVDERKTASIFDLWVEEAYRRKGIASALVQEAEKKARALGCYLVMVGTFDFQAKSFYENHGYTVNDTMSGVPKGHEHYFMTKRLDRPVMETYPSNTNTYEIIPGGEEDAKLLSGRLRRHDEAFAPREHEYVSIRKKVTDENGRIIAGLVGGVDGWNGTDIDALWVDDSYRRRGIGTRLLREFEREAKENGASIVYIEAYDWNAGFFRKNGYETVTGMLEDYPRGHTMYCMQKPLCSTH